MSRARQYGLIIALLVCGAVSLAPWSADEERGGEGDEVPRGRAAGVTSMATDGALPGPSSYGRQRPLDGRPASLESIRDQATRYLFAIRDGRTVEVTWVQAVLRNPATAVAVLGDFVDDDSARVRRETLALSAHAAARSTDSKLRQGVVATLVGALDDPESMVRQTVERDLLLFSPEDFSESAVDQIAVLAAAEKPGFAIVRVAGLATKPRLRPRLETIAAAEPGSGRGDGLGYFRTAQWAAKLGLSRLGDSEQALGIAERVASEPSDVVRVTMLLEDLAFAQHDVTLASLRGYLESDASFPASLDCAPRTRWAQHALDALARWTPGFPVERRRSVREYDDQMVDTALEWISEEQNRERRSKDSSNA